MHMEDILSSDAKNPLRKPAEEPRMRPESCFECHYVKDSGVHKLECLLERGDIRSGPFTQDTWLQRIRGCFTHICHCVFMQF